MLEQSFTQPGLLALHQCSKTHIQPRQGLSSPPCSLELPTSNLTPLGASVGPQPLRKPPAMPCMQTGICSTPHPEAPCQASPGPTWHLLMPRGRLHILCQRSQGAAALEAELWSSSVSCSFQGCPCFSGASRPWSCTGRPTALSTAAAAASWAAASAEPWGRVVGRTVLCCCSGLVHPQSCCQVGGWRWRPT